MRNDKALIGLAVVFVALFSFWTYRQVIEMRKQTADSERAFPNLPDTSSTSTQRKPEEAVTKPTSPTVGTSGAWTANDYKKGDITGKTYTVKYGDTLWEIAEGVYGNGSLWTNILASNSTQVGFLPNGSQALIFPGQVLTIP